MMFLVEFGGERKMFGQTFPLPRGLNDVFGRVRGGTKKISSRAPAEWKGFRNARVVK